MKNMEMEEKDKEYLDDPVKTDTPEGPVLKDAADIPAEGIPAEGEALDDPAEPEIPDASVKAEDPIASVKPEAPAEIAAGEALDDPMGSITMEIHKEEVLQELAREREKAGITEIPDEDDWEDDYSFDESDDDYPSGDMMNDPSRNTEKEKKSEAEEEGLVTEAIPLGWYLGYEVLFAIPVIGVICMLVFAFTSKNRNLRTFALSFLLFTLIALAVLSGMILAGWLNVPLGRA